MLDFTNQILSKNLKILRIKRGMSQNILADKCNLTLQYIQNIEYCKKSPSIQTLSKLSKALDISPAIFFIDLSSYESLEKIIKEYSEFNIL